MAAIIGGGDFKAWIYDKFLPDYSSTEKGQVILSSISMETIVKAVSRFYSTSPDQLTTVIKGPQKGNEARKIAMYLCQELADVKLKDLAMYFNLGHVGSVSFITHQVRNMMREDRTMSRRVDKILRGIVKQAT